MKLTSNQLENFDQYITTVNSNATITAMVIDQLKKDFGSLLNDQPALISGSNFYQELYQWVFPVMENLYHKDRQRFTALVYTVDAGFMKKRFKNRNESDLEQWVHAVVLRECLKVFIRLNYKPKENDGDF